MSVNLVVCPWKKNESEIIRRLVDGKDLAPYGAAMSLGRPNGWKAAAAGCRILGPGHYYSV